MFSKFLYLVGAALIALCLEAFGMMDITPYLFNEFAGVAAGFLGFLMLMVARGCASIGY